MWLSAVRSTKTWSHVLRCTKWQHSPILIVKRAFLLGLSNSQHHCCGQWPDVLVGLVYAAASGTWAIRAPESLLGNVETHSYRPLISGSGADGYLQFDWFCPPSILRRPAPLCLWLARTPCLLQRIFLKNVYRWWTRLAWIGLVQLCVEYFNSEVNVFKMMAAL